MDWNTIIISTVTSSTVVGLLTWAIQTYFQNKNETRLKILESELSKNAFVHSKVFESTQKAVNEIYKYVPELRVQVLEYMNVLNTVATTADDEKRARLAYHMVSEALKKCLETNRLYLPELTAHNLGMLRFEMDDVVAKGFCERQRSIDREKEALDLMFHYGRIDPLYFQVLSDLQNILGFKTESSNKKWMPSYQQPYEKKQFK